MDGLTGPLIDLWRRTPLSRRPRIQSIRRYPTRSDLPTTLSRRNIAVIGTPAKWAVLVCPCGTGHTIDLNLANPQTGQWSIQGDSRPTISPSIDVKDPAGRCHFWLRNGRIRWIQPPRS